MTSDYFWDCGPQHEHVATEVVFNRIRKDIHYEFLKYGGIIQYSNNV
jgi:hypothetical protein